jgi:20S proteasome alpha/beta subunit
LVRLPLFFSPEQFDRFQAATKDMVKNKRGTTTLAFIFDKGVIVAADSRASMGGYICEQLSSPGAGHGYGV